LNNCNYLPIVVMDGFTLLNDYNKVWKQRKYIVKLWWVWF